MKSCGKLLFFLWTILWQGQYQKLYSTQWYNNTCSGCGIIKVWSYNFPTKEWEKLPKHNRVAEDLTNIQTRHLQDENLECCDYTNPFSQITIHLSQEFCHLSQQLNLHKFTRQIKSPLLCREQKTEIYSIQSTKFFKLLGVNLRHVK